MSHSDQEAKELLRNTIGPVVSSYGGDNSRLARDMLQIFDTYDIAGALYEPDDNLCSRLEEYNKWREGKVEIDDPGALMEEIALLAFKALSGWSSIKSFTSYSHQHDLVISGDRCSWLTLMKFLSISSENARTIVVEAKNTNEPVDDSQFSRLCSVLQNKYGKQSELGVFLSRSGASHFPKKGRRQRQRVLRDARATQIIFHARTGKYVVVLDEDDIKQLAEPGSLPQMLAQKIRDVENVTGLHTLELVGEDGREVDLPPHLECHMHPEDGCVTDNQSGKDVSPCQTDSSD